MLKFNKSKKLILKPKTQRWEVHKDIIFPSVVCVKERIKDPIDDYYLYYSMHDAPGGIGLATAPNPLGPWKKYKLNPILRKNENAHHISSPHVIWNHIINKFVMYYHGCKEWKDQKATQTTGYAISYDGINWVKEDSPCIDKKDDNSWPNNELSYARVRYIKDKYIMTFMGRNKNEPPKIGIAYSNNGFQWEVQKEPLLESNKHTQEFVSTGEVFERDNIIYLTFFDEKSDATNSTIKIGEMVDNKIRKIRTLIRPGLFFQKTNKRVHDPTTLKVNGKYYLFYAGGPRRQSNGIFVRGVTEKLKNLY